MQARVKWVEDKSFLATSGSGHQIAMDANAATLAASPMEVLLMAIGGCSSVDVVMILEKARQAVSDCEVSIDSKRADDTPRVFTDIHLHFKITGTQLSETQVKRAVDLSAEKYCSVSIMLQKAVNITHSFEIIDAAN